MTSPNPGSPDDDPEQNEEGAKGAVKRKAGLIYQFCRALVRDQRMRRNLMCWVVMSAVVMLFIGWALLHGYLVARPLLFAWYWLVCAWLTMLSVLLAVFDILIQFAKGRTTRKLIAKQVLLEELERIQQDRERASGKD